MLNRIYDVVLVECEEGGYSAFVPALRGCWSEGETEAEATENIRIAITEFIQAIKDVYADNLLKEVTV